jgi:hypothetical protein
MATFTKAIRDILRAADFERREINGVPIAAMYRLSALGLIDPAWRSRRHSSPYHRVKLTNAGLRAARRFRKAEPDG